jgi:hypothetical protein
VPQSFKMVLPSTNTEPASNSVHSHNAAVIPKDWPSLPESSSMKRESSQAAVKGGGGISDEHARDKRVSNFKRISMRGEGWAYWYDRAARSDS